MADISEVRQMKPKLCCRIWMLHVSISVAVAKWRLTNITHSTNSERLDPIDPSCVLNVKSKVNYLATLNVKVAAGNNIFNHERFGYMCILY